MPELTATQPSSFLDLGVGISMGGFGGDIGISTFPSENVLFGFHFGFLYNGTEDRGQSSKRNWGWYNEYRDLFYDVFTYMTIGYRPSVDKLSIGGIIGASGEFVSHQKRNARDLGDRGDWSRSSSNVNGKALFGFEIRNAVNKDANLSITVTNRFVIANFGIPIQ